MADSSSTSSFSEIRRFVLRFLVLFAILVVFDQAIGAGLHWSYHRLQQGAFGPKINAAINEKPPLLIFGSSRAENHYIPAVLEKKTGLEGFNLGFGGQTILTHVGVLEAVLASYTPEVILLDMNVGDLQDPLIQKSRDRLAMLLPFASESKGVYDLMMERGRWESLKLLSAIYPYNSKLLSILKFSRRGTGISATRGYNPLTGSRMPELIARAESGDREEEPTHPAGDAYDISWVERFIERARKAGAKVVVVDSPRWRKHGYGFTDHEKKLLKIYRDRLKEMNVPVVSVTANEFPVFDDPALFKETIHLNDDGAKLFSRKLGDGLVALGIGSPEEEK